MKRRILGVGLVVFAIWPLVQYALVVRYDVDPWKLFGWAMYCVPGPMKTVRIYEIDDRQELFRLLDFQSYTPEEQRVVDSFRERRRALGRLASADALGRAFLEMHPDFEGIEVAVVHLVLDRDTATIRPRVERDTYWRDGRDEPFDMEWPPDRDPGAPSP